MDENNPMPAIEKMNLLADDFNLYNHERDKVYNFFKTYFDSNVIFNKIMEVVNDNN